ncbi:kinesin-like protein KIF25 [Pelodytes ibericus]
MVPYFAATCNIGWDPLGYSCYGWMSSSSSSKTFVLLGLAPLVPAIGVFPFAESCTNGWDRKLGILVVDSDIWAEVLARLSSLKGCVLQTLLVLVVVVVVDGALTFLVPECSSDNKKSNDESYFSYSELQTKFTTLQVSFQDLSEKYNNEKQRRKMLHNSLIEVKGNIRVHCRIRPLLPFDKQGTMSPHDGHGSLSEVIFAVDDETIFLKSSRPGHPITERTFNFEKVINPSESQQCVFEDVRPLVTSVLDGYNVCIMAYGQTGSGKTYTMMGPHSDNEALILNEKEVGIVPRAAVELFRLILEKPHGSHFVEVSIIEVYNNDIFDLLAQDNRGELGVKRDVITTKEGKSQVPSLTYESVKNAADVLDLVKKGLQIRVKQPTLIHDHSSRSHLVVTLTITIHAGPGNAAGMSDSEKLQRATKTKLQLVDLAGSECVGMSGVKGAALREASFINRSLSALSDVLGALAEHCSHIPYRNSRLTHLLQDSIGGDAKLLVMLCVSPCQKFTAESLQTLGFGTRARQVSRPSAKKRNQTLCNKVQYKKD